MNQSKNILFVVNVDWFFISHRLPIAIAAQKQGYTVHLATEITNKLIELENHGIVIHPLKINRSSIDLKSIFINLNELRKIYKLVNPDIIHLVTIKPVLLGGIMARLLKMPAVVAAISGLGFLFNDEGIIASARRFLAGILYRIALNHRNIKVIFQNPDDLNSVKKFTSISPKNTELIRGSGVNLNKFTYSPVSETNPIILLAARLLIDKGVREFVEAARILKNRACPARFVLVGTVDLANPASLTNPEIESWVNEGIVECWGHRSDMPQVLSSARIVVLPSYREGMPKVLLEAAACGRPVITTDVPGCRDAIDPGVTGLLVPVRSATELANAIEVLINNGTQCIAMGNSGRKLAENEFDDQKVAKKHLLIYEELINKS